MKTQVKKVVLTVAAFVAVNVLTAVVAPNANATPCPKDDCGTDTCANCKLTAEDKEFNRRMHEAFPDMNLEWITYWVTTDEGEGATGFHDGGCRDCDGIRDSSGQCTQHRVDLHWANKTCHRHSEGVPSDASLTTSTFCQERWPTLKPGSCP